MINLTAVVDGVSRDITSYTGAYELSDNLESLGAEFSFDLMSNPLDEAFRGLELPIGTKLIFSSDGEIRFSGIITSYDRSHLAIYSYKAFDYAFYLNKSQVQIQFNRVTATDAIQKLCKQQDVPVGEICDIQTVVTKIYEAQTVSDIIKDILKQASEERGETYRMEVRNAQLYVQRIAELYVNAKLIDIVGDFQSSYSMEDMANRIVVVSSKEKHTSIEATAEDSESITQYGQITHIERVDDKQKQQAQNIANKLLSEKGKIKRTFNVTCLGSDDVRAGRLLVFNQPEINLTGAFLVKHCIHRYDGKKHTMQLDLEV